MRILRDALSSNSWRWLAPLAILFSAVVVLTILGLAASSASSDAIGDEDGAADVPEFNPLGPIGSSWFVPLIGIPLRVRPEKVLDSPARKTLYGLVRAHPGIHLRGLVRSSGLGFGAVSYHLRVLQDYGYVSAFPSGVRLCFYPVGVDQVSTIPKIYKRRIQVLETVEQSPGAGLDELADAIGLCPKTIAYHVRALRAAGLVEPESFGRPLRLRQSRLDGTAQR